MAQQMFGSIEQFDQKCDSWNEYVERVEQLLIANEITERKKKVAILLTVIGSDTYALLRNVIHPEKPSEKTVKDIVDAMRKHLNPQPIVIAERYKFYARNQLEDETLSDYIASLRKLSEHWKFGDFLTEALGDKYVCGINSQGIRKKLLSVRDVKFDKALEISHAMEEAEKQADIMSRETHGMIQFFQKGKQRTPPQS